MTTNPRSLCFDPQKRVLMCEICFEDVTFDRLYVDTAGDKWDMCKPCGEKETP